MKAKVYWNLHRKCWSVLTKVGASWRVAAYCNYVVMQDVRFVVSEAGRQRVLREKRKNVHAFAIGTLVQIPLGFPRHQITYNPYKAGTFVTRDERALPVHYAEIAVFEGRTVTEYRRAVWA